MNITPFATENPIVLIVDDVPTNVKVLADALRQNYRIRIASNGQDALKRAQSLPYPDLILLDVMMPGMDGYQVLRSLNSQTTTRNIPVIFVTAKEGVSNEQMGFDLGAVDYIKKPFSIPVLRKRVHNHLAMKQYANILKNLLLLEPLTGMPNHRGLLEKLASAWQQALDNDQPLSLLVIAIDHFQSYNDHYGRGIGNECLFQVTQALKTGLTTCQGSTLAHYAEDKLAVILPNTAPQLAKQIAESLRACVLNLNLPPAPAATSSQVSISVGYATAEPGGTTLSYEQLLQQASEQLS